MSRVHRAAPVSVGVCSAPVSAGVCSAPDRSVRPRLPNAIADPRARPRVKLPIRSGNGMTMHSTSRPTLTAALILAGADAQRDVVNRDPPVE